jgi:hypothetical protein
MLGMSGQTRLPTNKQIRECIGQITQNELGEDEVKRRVREMREIAHDIMVLMEDHDPYLIGSTLSGDIRSNSDVDLHAYCDDFEILKDLLTTCGYEGVEEELVENTKGNFVHLRWTERIYPVEVTIYPWAWRHVVPISSVTGKPMKRADLLSVKKLLRNK